MQSYVQLTLNEYDELKKIQVEATTLVEQTNKNLSRKLTEANEKITELESNLRKYAIGGMRITEPLDLDVEDISVEALEKVFGKIGEQVPISLSDKEISAAIELHSPTQTRGSAKLGRRRWTSMEVAKMKAFAADDGEYLTSIAVILNRTVASIKTQASRMGLSCTNDRLSLEK